METLEGVLIEGVDFIGKTSVARRVTELVARSRPASLGRCYVSPDAVTAFLEQEAAKSEDMKTRDFFYSAALVVDLAGLVPPPDFRVQDRHWLTQLGRNAFFYPDDDTLPRDSFVRAHRPFRRNVLLTSSPADKAARASRRAATSPRDRYLRDNPGAHQEYEVFLTTLVTTVLPTGLPAEEDWLVLDTTGRSVDQVAADIADYCGFPARGRAAA